MDIRADSRKAAADFLRRHNMHPDCIDPGAECEKFRRELEAGLCSPDSSLMMLPTYLPAEGSVTPGRRVVSMEANGADFSVAVVSFEPEGEGFACRLESLTHHPMPGADLSITRGEFLEQITDFLEPFLCGEGQYGQSPIGFCFTYPAEPMPNHDGLLMGDDLRVAEAENMEICAELAAFIAGRRGAYSQNFTEQESSYTTNRWRDGGASFPRFALVNAGAAVLLAGGALYGTPWMETIGMALNERTNACYAEPREALAPPLLQHVNYGSMIIDTCSAYYDKMPRGDLDVQFDRRMVNPGEHPYEKMVTGDYLSGLVALTAGQAAREGLFSVSSALDIMEIRRLRLCHLNEFCHDTENGGPLARACATERERETLKALIELIIDRAAKLVAVSIAAIAEKRDMGRDKSKPFLVAVDDNTLRTFPLYAERLRDYLNSLVTGRLSRYCRLEQVKNANLIGAAVGVMLITQAENRRDRA